MDTPNKSFRTADVFALAFGSMIGVGWVIFCGQWAVTGGTIGAMLAFAVGAVFCIIVGLAYAELTPAFPEGGGGVTFAKKAMGNFPALIAGLATVFAYLGVAAWKGPSLISSIDYIVPIPKFVYLWTVLGSDVYLSEALLATACAVFLIFLNVRGSRGVAVFQTTITILILLIGAMFLFGGVAFGDVSYTKPYFTSVSGFAAVVLIVPAMFVGFDVIPQAAGEMSFPLRKIPKILIVSILAAAAWYILMIFATCLSAPESVRINGAMPVGDAMAFAYGHPFWGKLCILGGIAGIVTGWNGFLFGAARCLYAMASQGLLPAFFAKTHPKYKTPANAICFCGFVCIVMCFLGIGTMNLLMNVSSFGTVICYAMAVLSLLVLRKTQPSQNRPYRIRNIKLYSALSIPVVLFFLYLYLPTGPSSLSRVEWSIVLGWFFLGIVLYLCCRGKNHAHRETV